MSTKKHGDHPHLSGEYRWGDLGQLILFALFMGVWISDSFVFKYTTSLNEVVPNSIRLIAAALVLFPGWYLARKGMKAVFGTTREEPGVISTGVFNIVRHPIYTGAILFYLGAIMTTLSLASAAFWILIVAFYIMISRYEERILTEEFGNDYLEYKKRTGMLFPKLRSH